MLVAAIIATPLSIGLALFMSEIAPNWAKSITRPAMEVFVGIPSVVYGWLGLTILVPFLRTNFHSLGFNVGFSWFAGSLVLALMILPTDHEHLVRLLPRPSAVTCGPHRWRSAPPAGRRSATSCCGPRPPAS